MWRSPGTENMLPSPIAIATLPPPLVEAARIAPAAYRVRLDRRAPSMEQLRRAWIAGRAPGRRARDDASPTPIPGITARIIQWKADPRNHFSVYGPAVDRPSTGRRPPVGGCRHCQYPGGPPRRDHGTRRRHPRTHIGGSSEPPWHASHVEVGRSPKRREPAAFRRRCASRAHMNPRQKETSSHPIWGLPTTRIFDTHCSYASWA